MSMSVADDSSYVPPEQRARGMGLVGAAFGLGFVFRLGFLFLSKRKREALSAVYAFCRHVDDIADSGELPPEEASRQLAFWREEMYSILKSEDAKCGALSRD